MPDLPKLSTVWWQLQPAFFVDPAQAYANGFIGAWSDPEGREKLKAAVESAGGMFEARDVAVRYGMVNQGAGKLCLITEEIAKAFGRESLPGAAQQVGDCVSHSTKNGILGTLSTAITHGLSGKPEVSPVGARQGVLAPEAIYANRGYAGDGWSCEEALAVAIGKIGAVVRQDYPEIGWDLTLYSQANAHKYGSRLPDKKTLEVLGQHRVQTVTECKTYEEVRDLIASGFGITSCGSEGFANERNEDGVAARSGRWAHAMAYLGVDDREETKKKYGCGLICLQNSWGRAWISGSTRIRGTELSIPEGSFWAKWTDVQNRFAAAINTVQRWENRKLPDWGLESLI